MSSSITSEPRGTKLALPRRALRRGTRSCAECKRRKTRCFFDRSAATTCVACQRRGLPCIGQEFMDVPLPDLGGEQSIVERLRWAEHILGTISKDLSSDGQGAQPDKSSTRPLCLDLAQDQVMDQGRTSLRSDEESLADAIDVLEPVAEEHTIRDNPFLKYSEINNTLVAHFPSQEDANLLIGTGKAILFVQAICHDYGGHFPPISTLVNLPDVTAHPVLLARKLLQIALCIQRLDPALERRVLNLNMYPKDAMDTYFTLASNMVTCHDELLDSIEGFECLAYQGVYLVNSGNLRRALMCFRRATTIAQFMGLDRKVAYQSLKQHDRATNVCLAVIWARIAYLERYLSLLLGLPTTISQVRFASDAPSVGTSSTDWFERTQTDICERVIERNQRCTYDDLATHKIDSELNEAAKVMPEKWWAPLDLSQCENSHDVMMRILSAQMQMIHYNLLIVLHLPYLLGKPDKSRHEYSKTTCVYASREVLNRFIAFRSIVKVVTCCRLVDFCAFTAALTLLLAYLNSHKRNSGLMLVHQRLGDRALIEAAMETMEELNILNNDGLSRKTAELTRKLLTLEAECARGGQTYNSSPEEQADNTVGCEENSFLLKIPYFGTVKIASDAPPPPQSPENVMKPTPSTRSLDQDSTWSHSVLVQPVTAQNDYLPHQIYLPEQIPAATDQPFSPLGQSGMGIQDANSRQFDWEMPDLIASANDWAFQGVDSAFFNAFLTSNASETTGQGGYMYCV